MLIAIEGLDASGKETHSKILNDYFKQGYVNSTRVSFPDYDSISGQLLKGFLKNDWTATTLNRDCLKFYSANIDAYAFQCCHIANKLECIPDAMWVKNTRDVFIADRYIASAYAYGTATGFDLNWLIKLHRNLPQADLNILLDISVDESFKRRPARRDEYEKNSKLLNDVATAYRSVFSTLGQKYVTIDAMGNKEETASKILDVVKRFVVNNV